MESGSLLFCQDEQSNPSQNSVMVNVLNDNVEQIKWVISVTLLYLVGELCLLLSNGPSVFMGVPLGRGFHKPSQTSGSLSFPSFLLLWCPPSGVLLHPPSIPLCNFLWLQPCSTTDESKPVKSQSCIWFVAQLRGRQLLCPLNWSGTNAPQRCR